MKPLLKYSSLLILLFLIITNPSISAFKGYLGAYNYRDIERTCNFFLFSYYVDSRNGSDDHYFAITGNFFYISEDKNTLLTNKISKAVVENRIAIEDPEAKDSITVKRNNRMLFIQLKKDGIYSKSYIDFKQQFSTRDKIDKLYCFLTQKGKYDKSLNDFEKQFFTMEKLSLIKK